MQPAQGARRPAAALPPPRPPLIAGRLGRRAMAAERERGEPEEPFGDGFEDDFDDDLAEFAFA